MNTSFLGPPRKHRIGKSGSGYATLDWAMNNSATQFTNDVFVFYVVERMGDKDKNLTYTWGAPEETSVGLNLQWLLTSCYILPQEQTRPYLRRRPPPVHGKARRPRG